MLTKVNEDILKSYKIRKENLMVMANRLEKEIEEYKEHMNRINRLEQVLENLENENISIPSIEMESYNESKENLNGICNLINSQIKSYNETRLELQKLHNALARTGLINEEF